MWEQRWIGNPLNLQQEVASQGAFIHHVGGSWGLAEWTEEVFCLLTRASQCCKKLMHSCHAPHQGPGLSPSIVQLPEAIDHVLTILQIKE